MQEFIVTVMSRDRVGIVRDVSSALTAIDGNITHVKQTVMRGYFTLIMSVQMPGERTSDEIRGSVTACGGDGELEVSVRPLEEAPAEDCSSERFTLTLRGTDQKGIICRVTSHLAERDINIDDFYAFVIDGRFAYLFQVCIPSGVDIDELMADLKELGREFNLIVHLQHRNIFRATSEVRPVSDL